MPSFSQGFNLGFDSTPEPIYFENDLATYLRSQGIHAFPLYVPQKATFPCISFTKTSEQRYPALGTSQRTVCTLVTAEYDIDCWGKFTENLAASRSLFNALHNYRGLMGDSTVKRSELLTELDLYDPPIDGGKTGVAHRVCQYRFTYLEQSPTGGS